MNTTDPDRDTVARLLQQAGLRPDVDAERMARVRRGVHARWRAALRRRRRQRWSIAAAACLALALVAAAWLGGRPAMDADGLAVVVDVAGSAMADGAARPLRVGDRLAADSVLRTVQGAYAVLGMDAAGRVRVDSATELRLASPELLELRHGGVYVDSDGHRGEITVVTPLLRARDVGTRFMVRHTPADGSEVSVRDGIVVVHAAGASRLDANERLRIDPAGVQVRDTIAAGEPPWHWEADAAPQAADAPALRDVLERYAREHGLKLVIEDEPQLRDRLSATLQGDLSGLQSEQLLDIAREVGPLRIRRDDRAGMLHVSR